MDDREQQPLRPLNLRDAILKDLLTQNFQHSTKMNPAAITLASKFIRAFLEEACHRATAEALDAADPEVTEEHLEKILPQLLLDMGP